MNNSFFDYLHRLELIAFFSGYPIIYTIALLIAGNRLQRNELKRTVAALLPYSYALVATLYLGFELKNLYPNYTIDNIRDFAPQPLLFVWGILAVIFWIPAMAKRTYLPLLHSLVFFMLLVSDLFFADSSSPGSRDAIRNDMKLYTASLILNSLSLITVALIYFLVRWLKSFRKSSSIIY